jgi:hypothetical protein
VNGVHAIEVNDKVVEIVVAVPLAPHNPGPEFR